MVQLQRLFITLLVVQMHRMHLELFLGDSFEFIPTFDMSQTDGDAIRAALAEGAGTVIIW